MIWRFLRLSALLLLLAVPALAQDTQSPGYKAFDTEATQVESAVAEGKVLDSKLSEMRAEMVKWRSTFTNAQDVNADQIATVKSQIAALGPTPAEGASEDPAIAKRRDELNASLTKLQAPVLSATEAASRADSIIRSIDKLTRERQADKLLRLSPSVLNPANWPAAVTLFRWMSSWIYDETRWRFTQPVNFDSLRDNAPLIAVLVVLSIVLLLKGGRWMARLTEWLLNKTAMRGHSLISGLVSLGMVVLPVLGATMLVTAVDSTSLFGPILTQLYHLLPIILAIVMMAWWLGGRVFPSRDGVESALSFNDEGRAEGRFQALMLGIALGLHVLVIRWIAPRAENYLGGAGDIGSDKAQVVAERADAAMSMLYVPLEIFAALVMFRLAQLVRRQVRARKIQSDDDAFARKLLQGLANVMLVVAVVAPLLGVIGYVSAAEALIWPMTLTLGVLATLAVAQAFVGDLYVIVSRSEEARRDSLVPVLVGFGLILASVPVLALVWGARVSDLVELWTSFRAGVSVGGVRISPTVFLMFATVFVAGYAMTRALQGALRASLLPKTKIDKGGQSAIISGVGYIGIFLAAVIAISSAGIDLSSLAIVAGALSVGVGFGLQTIVQNFVSGIILLIERPISEGDWIEVGTQQGIVKAITVRSTRIETFDRSEVIVPNADLISGQVTNWTRANVTGRLIVPVGVAYGTDTRKVEKILIEVAENQPLIMMNPEPYVLFVAFGASSLDFEVRAILSDVNFKLRVMSEMNHEINARFAEAGIEVPFPQSDLWLRNPEVLRDVGRGEPSAQTPDKPDAQSEPAAPAEAITRTDLGRPAPGEGIEDIDVDGDGDGGAR
ncbi:DUF3772 domain-containing protein [Thioclava sp.]|uniref:DUF3772 domain-containing protein n=1 Tax=Thioclava sp. TaxID=1933450 RepID=UPI003AA960D2